MLQRLGPGSRGATHTPSSEIATTPQSEALVHSRWPKSVMPWHVVSRRRQTLAVRPSIVVTVLAAENGVSVQVADSPPVLAGTQANPRSTPAKTCRAQNDVPSTSHWASETQVSQNPALLRAKIVHCRVELLHAFCPLAQASNRSPVHCTQAPASQTAKATPPGAPGVSSIPSQSTSTRHPRHRFASHREPPDRCSHRCSSTRRTHRLRRPYCRPCR